jgi:hypothetical protein
MKYIKKFEDNVNYEIGIFTINNAKILYRNILENNDYNYNLEKKLHYFSYNDFDTFYASDTFIKTCRFIIAYNKNDILGICKFAYFDLSDNYSISYLSTNNDFLSIGVSKKILDMFFKYFSKKYPNNILSFSGYSVEGWLYLRKNILTLSKKYNVKIKEKGVEYPGTSGYNDDFFNLVDKSKKEINKIYTNEKYTQNFLFEKLNRVKLPNVKLFEKSTFKHIRSNNKYNL